MFWGIGRPGRWREIDLLLVEALGEYEAGLCTGCGHPLAETSNPEHPLHFTVTSVTCAACAALKENPESEKPNAGQMFYVINNRGTGKY